MPRFRSSLVDSQCPFAPSPHTHTHTHTPALSHSRTLGPDERPEQRLRPGGHSARQLGVRRCLSRTLSALGTNWLWYRVSSMCLCLRSRAVAMWISLPCMKWGGGKSKFQRHWRQHTSTAAAPISLTNTNTTHTHTPLPAVVVRSVLMASLRHMLVFGGHHPHRVRRSVLLSRAAVLPCSH